MARKQTLTDATPTRRRTPAPFINQTRAEDGCIRDLPKTYPDAATTEKDQFTLGAGTYRVVQVKTPWRTLREATTLIVAADTAAPKPADTLPEEAPA